MLGIDLLGGPKYTQQAVEAFGKLSGTWAVGVFWKEYGHAKGFLNKLYAAGCRTFRVHILWDPTHNYAKLRNSEANAASITGLLNDYADCVGAWREWPGARLFVSLCCEHQLPADDMKHLIRAAVKRTKDDSLVLPFFVDSPNGGWPWIADDGSLGQGITLLREVHTQGLRAGKGNAHKPKGRYIVSSDGDSIRLTEHSASTYNQNFHDAAIRFAWDWTFNCHKSHADKGRGYRPKSKEIVAFARCLRPNPARKQTGDLAAPMAPGLLASASRSAGILGAEGPWGNQHLEPEK